MLKTYKKPKRYRGDRAALALTAKKPRPERSRRAARPVRTSGPYKVRRVKTKRRQVEKGRTQQKEDDLAKKDDYGIVPVTEEEVRENPSRQGKWKIMIKGNGQLNGDFSSEEDAEEYLDELFPDHEEPDEPELEGPSR